MGVGDQEPAAPALQAAPAGATWHSNRPPTIHDVAIACGVAASTVSRAFSNPGRVSTATRDRILAIAHSMGYQPNPIARALPLGRTMTIGLLVPDITNPYFVGLVRGAERQASTAGYTIVLADTQESGDTEANVADRLCRAVDGLVILSSRMSDEQITGFSRRTPIVLVNRVVASVPRVIIDVGAAVQEALTHLVALGHRRIGYLPGPTVSWSNTWRVRSLRTAARRLGVEMVAIKGSGAPSLQAGNAAAEPVLRSAVTAVIAFNDLLAIGLLHRFAALGVRVPQDISVVGSDDIFGADFSHPPLTTLRGPTEDAGRIAMELLLAAAMGVAPESPTEVTLKASLVLRESTGAPPPTAVPAPATGGRPEPVQD